MIEDDRRAPTDICFDTLDALGHVWAQMSDQNDESKFIELVVHPTWDEGITGAKRLGQISADLVDPAVRTDVEWLHAGLEVAVAFACEVQFCAKHGEIELAWQRLTDAKYWLGFITAEWHRIKLKDHVNERAEIAPSVAAKTLSELGLNARHAENHAMRAELGKWFDEHGSKYPSLPKAAEAAAGKVLPVAYSTAVKWLREDRPTKSRKKPH